MHVYGTHTVYKTRYVISTYSLVNVLIQCSAVVTPFPDLRATDNKVMLTDDRTQSLGLIESDLNSLSRLCFIVNYRYSKQNKHSSNEG